MQPVYASDRAQMSRWEYNRQLGIRRSYLHESRRIATDFIQRKQQTLVFANNRLAMEVLLTYLRNDCERGPIPGEMIRGYRGGYLPRERRDIERKLRNGDRIAATAVRPFQFRSGGGLACPT